MLDKNAKIYVAGHRGLVGSAIWKNLEEKGYTNLIGKTHTELDLLDGVAVRRFFDEEQPEYVFLAAAFVGFDAELYEMTVHGFRLFALCYIFCGLNIYASAFFTALCNGALSALIAFTRTLLLRGGLVLVMPVFFGVDGVWWSVAAAELLGVVLSVVLLVLMRRRYHYA